MTPRRWLAAGALALGGFVPGGLVPDLPAPAAPATSATSPAPAADAVPGPVVVLGVAGLRWDDVSDTTPALQALLANGSLADLIPRSVGDFACPADGWLALSAGRRADAPRAVDGGCVGPGLRQDVPGGPATVQGWDAITERAASQGFSAEPGALGRALAAAGRTTAAIGPGAAVALAEPDGTAPHVWSAGDDGAPAAALATRPDVLVIDLGAIVGDGADRAAQVDTLDVGLVGVLNALPATATVLVTSLADSPPPSNGARMQFTALVGPRRGGGSFPPTVLRGGSTRQDGLILATDLAPTVLDLLDLPRPSVMDGAAPRPLPPSGSEADRLEHLIDLDLAAITLPPLVVPLMVSFVAAFVAAAAVLLVLLRTAHAGATALRRRLLAGVHVVGVLAACFPAATLLGAGPLVPWWRSEAAGAVLAALTAGWTVLLAAVALLGPWRRHRLGPVGAASALTMLVFTADVATGSTLSLTTPLGGQPLVAGRFYGFGNPVFAIVGTAAIVLAVAVADALAPRTGRRGVVLSVAGIGAVTALVDVLPALGSDVGGSPALLPAFAVLALRLAGTRLTWSRALAVAAGTTALVTGVAVVDWLRPADERTHLGRFVQTALDGGAWQVIRRKLGQNLEILVGSPVTLAMPVLIALAGWALMRPARFGLTGLVAAYRQIPALTDGLVALGVMLAIGFVANDTGTSIPPTAGLLAAPLLVAVSARALGPGAPPPGSSPAPRRGPRSGGRRG